MTTKRLALGVATGVLVLGVGAGVYAVAQTPNQDPRPGMGRGMGPFDFAQGRPGGLAAATVTGARAVRWACSRCSRAS